MQGLSSSKGQKLSKSNGSLHTLLSQSSTAASQHGPLRTHLLHAISLDEASDSSHNSIQSFPSYGSRLKPAQSQFSASMGHINHIGGSLDRVSRSPKDPLAPEKVPLSCKSMATLSRLQSPGEPPPPYEFTYSLENAVKQLEDRLQETGGELRQLKRSLSETEDPFTQVSCGANTLGRGVRQWCLSVRISEGADVLPLGLLGWECPSVGRLSWDSSLGLSCTGAGHRPSSVSTCADRCLRTSSGCGWMNWRI